MKGNKYSVITCNKCGEKNSDETRFCTKCDSKLQSSRQTVTSQGPSLAPLDPFQHEGVPPDSRRTLMRMLEAWVYVALLGIIAAGCAIYETWWPLYPAVALLGLALWLRRV